MSRSQKDQHTVGTPTEPRGQQMGFKGRGDQNREEVADTPALRGRRKNANKMFSDASSQHIGSDATKPSTNSPSLPAMHVAKKGDTGGETVFKRRLAKKRAEK
ncbi:MAG: hypothetical protein ABR555_01190 [Pyrinomonadaceae bacterium]